MNKFELIHIDAEKEKQRKWKALREWKPTRKPDYSLSTREALIAKAERDVLARQSIRGLPSRATQIVQQRVYVQNTVGDWVRTKEPVITHDKDYIASEIYKIIATYGVTSLQPTGNQYQDTKAIYEVLETVSYRYSRADSVGLDKPPVVFKHKSKKKAKTA